MAVGEQSGTALPLLLPLGDCGLLVRFGAVLSDAANRRTVAFSRRLRLALPEGVTEIAPNLVSVLLKYDPVRIDFERLAGQVRLLLSDVVADADADVDARLPRMQHQIAITFGGSAGPDLVTVAEALRLTPAAFIAAHNAAPLRVLATGFAPGFVYCGFHPEALRLPRRTSVRPPVAPGSVLFAAGQTAIASTAIPTGWHVIGRTEFRNFDASADPPTQLREGDTVIFTALPS